jgi:hypothetical protein
MKIIQILDRITSENNFLMGLGDDGNVYTYSYVSGTWKPYKASKKPKTTK